LLRFALWSLRSRWPRILTLCLGLICISICTTLLAGLAQLSTLSADQQLNRAWQSAPYDLLVRSPSALSSVERQLQIVDPSAPEQTYGGISLQQVDAIAHIPHVAAVAPEAVIGWVTLRPYVLITFNRPGLYRVTTQLMVQGSKSPPITLQNLYEVLPLAAYTAIAGRETAKLTYIPLDASGTATVAAFWPLPTLLVGIDPGAEARLSGLQWQTASMKSGGTVRVPLLMDTHPWISLSAMVTAEYAALPDPGKNGDNRPATANGDNMKVPSSAWAMFAEQQLDGKSLLNILALELGGKQQIPCLGACAGNNVGASLVSVRLNGPLQGGGIIRYARPGYTITTLPDNANNAPTALSVLTMGADAGGLLTRLPLLPEATTPWITFNGSGGSFTTFDSTKLPLIRDNASSWEASGAAGLYLPQPGTAPPGLSPQHSLISLPPLLFTTVSAACQLTGSECVSAVRVRVAGVDSFSQRSEAILQQVAADIERRTGLHVDVLRGASGKQIKIQVALTNKSITTFSEVWIQPHAAVTIANGVSGANILLLLSEVSVAALALIAAALLSTSSRATEFAILMRIGWSSGKILIESFIESMVTAFLAALPAWGFALLLNQLGIPSIAPVTILYALSVAILLYLIVSTFASRAIISSQGGKQVVRGADQLRVGAINRVLRASSYRGNYGASSNNQPWWLLVFYRQAVNRPGSIALVVLSILGACGLVSLMLLVYWGLDGLLYTTLLGQQVQITLSGIHLVTAALTCASAVLTAGLIILMMVRERKREFAMLLAIGWRGRTVAQEVVREGMLLGFSGGLSGGIVAMLIFLLTYHIWSPLLFIGAVVAAAALGMMLGVLGAFYPAQLAGRMSPRRIFISA
jgi:hypothetical protein